MKRIISVILLSAGIFFAAAAQETISLDRGAGTIYGELLIPEGVANPPIALIIPEMGPMDMNGNSEMSMISAGQIKMLAQDLTAEGIATFRYDKRGVGLSEAGFSDDDTLEDYVADASALVDLLANDNRLGDLIVIGNGEGAWIGERLALNNSKISKLVLLYGSGRTMVGTLQEQLGAAELPPVYMDEINRVIESLQRGEKVDDVMPDLAPVFGPELQDYILQRDAYDPAQMLGELTIPIMIVQGDMDVQMSADEADILKEANAKALKTVIKNMNQALKFIETTDINQQMATFMTPDVPNHPELAPAIAKFIKADSRVGFVF